MTDRNDADRQRSVDAALRIIEALMSGGTDPELAARMREWFANEHGEAVKQDAFMEYSERILPYTGKLHDDALERYNRLASKLGLQTLQVYPEVVEAKSKRSLRSRIRYWRIAAVLIPVAAIITVYFITRPAVHSLPEMRIAAAGYRQEAFLPDSSFVSVSPHTTLYYRETPEGVRTVELSGETLFKVRKADGKPFRVSTAVLSVTVLGTDFNVSAFPADSISSVSLFEGDVVVATAQDDITMSAGDLLIYDNLTGEYILTVINADEMRANGYRPLLRFDNASLGEVLRTLGTVFGVEVEIADDIGAEAGRYSLNLEKKTLDGALKLLAVMNNNDIEYFVEDGRVSVSRKR